MFEYLMPILVMPTYPNTLLDQTYKAVTRRQVEYGKARGVPWGVSESGYNAVDTASNYQYRAFGVPGLGLKRRLAEDLVIAPYATLLALMVEPEAACVNLQHLPPRGCQGSSAFMRPSTTHRPGAGAGERASCFGRTWRIIRGWVFWLWLICCSGL
jgi:cyclic beta-1,2-glucan synthetase